MAAEPDWLEELLCEEDQDTSPQSRAFVRAGILAITLIAFVLLGLLMASCASGEEPAAGLPPAQEGQVEISDRMQAEEPNAQSEVASANSAADLNLLPTDLDAIPSGKKLQVFALSDAEGQSNAEPRLTEKQRNAIAKAIRRVEEYGDVGVVFFNASTGQGVSYNVDQAVYGASSLKGPYAVYVCQHLVENGKASLQDVVPLCSSNEGSIPVDTSQLWVALDANGAASVQELIASSVKRSDNGAFGMLRNEFDRQGWNAWTESLGVSDAPQDPTSWYAWYCARSSAKLWLSALNYFESGTKTSAWLAPLFKETNLSFIRDGVEKTGAKVMNKSGWCGGMGQDFDSTCDASIITLDGQTYIMSIMTTMPYCDEAAKRSSALAKALFGARSALDGE